MEVKDDGKTESWAACRTGSRTNQFREKCDSTGPPDTRAVAAGNPQRPRRGRIAYVQRSEETAWRNGWEFECACPQTRGRELCGLRKGLRRARAANGIPHYLERPQSIGEISRPHGSSYSRCPGVDVANVGGTSCGNHHGR